MLVNLNVCNPAKTKLLCLGLEVSGMGFWVCEVVDTGMTFVRTILLLSRVRATKPLHG